MGFIKGNFKKYIFRRNRNCWHALVIVLEFNMKFDVINSVDGSTVW